MGYHSRTARKRLLSRLRGKVCGRSCPKPGLLQGGQMGLSPRWHWAEGPWKLTACLGWHTGEVAAGAQSLWRWCFSVSAGAVGLVTPPPFAEAMPWVASQPFLTPACLGLSAARPEQTG